MPERIYTDHPILYDAIQSEWPYDRDVEFVVEALARHDVDGDDVLEVGCGTGEHTRRLVSAGFDVTAVDTYAGMLDVAREKCRADFRQQTLPDLDLDTRYDAVVAIRGVVNHLAPDALSDAIAAIENHLTPGGLLIFDNATLPPEGNHAALDVGTAPDYGDYARIAQQVPTGENRLEWREAVFTGNGDFFVNTRLMTPFNDAVIADALADYGFTVQTHDGFDADDRRTVFVATTS